jgi:imidazolonepropionase-like amidohydrolase
VKGACWSLGFASTNLNKFKSSVQLFADCTSIHQQTSPQNRNKMAQVQAMKPWTAAPRRRYRLVDATIIDVKDGQVYQHCTIDLLNGRIHRLSKLSQGPPPGDETMKWTQGEEIIINLNGKFVMPGLIDCHVHLATPPGEDGLRDTMSQDPETSLLRQPYLAHQMLKRGFTTVRDCGGAGLAIKEALAEGLVPGPRLITAGHGISQTGGHGDIRSSKDAEYQCCGGNVRGLGRIADGVEQCLHAAREEMRRGADFIKIMASGGVVSPTDRLANIQYTPAEIQAFCSVAKDSGTYVTAHAYTPAAIRNAVTNGVLGIEHGNFIDESTAKLMAVKGAYLTPTLVTYEAMASKEFGSFLPPSIAAKNLQVLEAGLQSVKVADEAGVTMCYGTDLLGPLQTKQNDGFRLLQQAGQSPLKILQSATINAAKMLRHEEQVGRIKDGYFADLLILNANPLEDIEVLCKPEKHLLAVIKDGRVVESRWSKLSKEDGRSNEIE